LLTCTNKAQPDPCYTKSQLLSWSRSHVTKEHSSGSGAMLTKPGSSEAGAISFLQELRSPASPNDGFLCLVLEIKLVSNPYVSRHGIFFLMCSSHLSCSTLSFLLAAPLLYCPAFDFNL